jgi:hypothetical protein
VQPFVKTIFLLVGQELALGIFDGYLLVFLFYFKVLKPFNLLNSNNLKVYLL